MLLAMPLTTLSGNLYVSTTGTYNELPAYTNLQEAINAAVSGDTVWVEDGFVCETGRTTASDGSASRLSIDKGITVRSRSGSLEAPVIVRGAWHDPLSEVACGDNAIRCVRMSSVYARLIGFQLENGATVSSADWTVSAGSGGGFYGSGVLSNCLIMANHAASGGGAAGTNRELLSLYDCVVSNNHAALSAGGIKSAQCFNTAVVDNRSDGDSGGFRAIDATNCLIAQNHAIGQGGGGLSVKGSFVDCVITNNESGTNGGGVYYTPTLTRCLVGWNRATDDGGGACGGAATAPVIAFDSSFVSNVADGSGGGARYIVASNCLFDANFAAGTGGGAAGGVMTSCVAQGNVVSNTAWGKGCGGGFANATLTNCLVASNHARGGETISPGIGTGGGVYGTSALVVNCILSNNTSRSRGGGMHLGTGYNNLVIDNRGQSNGGGVCGGTHYNTLILRNSTTGPGGGAGYQTTLYNCTVMENNAPSQAGVQDCDLVNTISWGNVGGADRVSSAIHSCGAVLTEAHGTGNTTVNPNIATSGKYRYLPAPGSPCINGGILYPWMSDPKDFRAWDLSGRKRVIDDVVDMGAFESPIRGYLMIIR